jgi:hypothetical protein
LIFPGLNILNIDDDKKLRKVNDFEAKEISCKVGKIVSSEGKTDDMSLNFWYTPGEGKNATLLIVEFAFGYSAKKLKNADRSDGKSLLEQFPISFVSLVNALFYDLQEGRFVDRNSKIKTKTEYAYNEPYKL